MDRVGSQLDRGERAMEALTRAPSISVIVPTLNEAATIAACVELLAAEPDVLEVLVADGGSTDQTREIARRIVGVQVIEAPLGRAWQLNRAAAQAQGSILWFVHADTQIQAGAAEEVVTLSCSPQFAVGAFHFAIDQPGARNRLIERLTSWRCRWFGLPYGDQGVFVRRELFARLGGFPEQPILEDVHFVRAAKRHGRCVISARPIFTSPRRWDRHGLVRVFFQHQWILLLDALGVSPATIARQRADR
jgi:rSAM/selenodomain-associated transferase 2